LSENQGPSREAWIRALVSRVTLARGYRSALGGILKRLCRAGGWSYAESWIPTHDGLGLKMGPVVLRVRTDEVCRFRQRGRELGFRPGQGLVGQVFLTGVPKWIPSLGGDGELPRRQVLAKEAGFASAAAFPLLLEDRAVSVLVFYASEPRAQEPALVEKTGVALAALGPALEQKRIEMLVRAQARQNEVVAGIGLRALDTSTDIPSLLEEAAELAAKTLDADAAAVLQLLEDGRLTVRASAGWKGEGESTIADPYFAEVVAANKPVAVTSFRADGGFPAPSLLAAAGARSAATAVIPGRARPLGLLTVLARGPRRFPEDNFLKAVAALASGITHDMNNVMLPALCRLDAIEAAGLSASAKREIEGVRGAFDQLRRLTRGLQLFATSPEDASFPASTRLEVWWREVGALLAMALRRDVQLSATFPEGLPPVAAAPSRLTHAVLGLVHILGEAFDGPGRMLVRAEPQGTRFVRLSIADASPGPRGRALEPLAKRVVPARSFALSVGGSLAVGPEEITLLLPVAAAAAEPLARPRGLAPRRAEVVLKDPRAAAFVTSLLTSAGFEVSPRREASVLAVWDGSEDPAEVRRYLAVSTARRVLLLGTPPAYEPGRRVSVVAEPTNLEAVRRTLGAMVEELLELTDDSIRTDAGPLRR
jgi:signal transduction histidine kinase